MLQRSTIDKMAAAKARIAEALALVTEATNEIIVSTESNRPAFVATLMVAGYMRDAESSLEVATGYVEAAEKRLDRLKQQAEAKPSPAMLKGEELADKIFNTPKH